MQHGGHITKDLLGPRGAPVGGGGINWLLRDTFSTSETAPLVSPRTCDGAGIAVLLDTGNKASIAGGQYGWASGTGNFDPGYVHQTALARTAGVCILFRVYPIAARVQLGCSIQLIDVASGRRGVFDLNGINLGLPVSSGGKTGIGTVATLALNTSYSLAIILRTDGARYAIKGGAYTSWKLLFNEQDGNVSPVYAFAYNLGTTTNILFDEIASAQLSGVFATDGDNYAVSQESPVSGVAYQNTEAEGLYNMLCTAPATLAGSAELRYDVIDDDNYSVAYFDDAGAFRVDSVVEGSATPKANVAGVVSGGQSVGIKVNTFGATHRYWTYIAASGWTKRADVTTMPVPTSKTFAAVFSSYSVSKLESEAATVMLPFDDGSSNADFWTYGDSKTAGVGDDTDPLPLNENGFQPDLLSNLRAAGGNWHEIARIGIQGNSVADMASLIDTQLAAMIAEPDHILINLGRNNSDYKESASQWVTNFQYIIEAMHAKFPRAQIYIMRVGARADPDIWGPMGDTHIPQVVAGRAWAHLGPDERVFLEGGDDYHTYAPDGSHPNRAGYALTAQQWQISMI